MIDPTCEDDDVRCPKPEMAELSCADLLADLRRTLDAAVSEYDTALMRNPMDDEEIRRAVNKCSSARERLNSALANVESEGRDQ